MKRSVALAVAGLLSTTSAHGYSIDWTNVHRALTLEEVQASPSLRAQAARYDEKKKNITTPPEGPSQDLNGNSLAPSLFPPRANLQNNLGNQNPPSGAGAPMDPNGNPPAYSLLPPGENLKKKRGDKENSKNSTLDATRTKSVRDALQYTTLKRDDLEGLTEEEVWDIWGAFQELTRFTAGDERYWRVQQIHQDTIDKFADFCWQQNIITNNGQIIAEKPQAEEGQTPQNPQLTKAGTQMFLDLFSACVVGLANTTDGVRQLTTDVFGGHSHKAQQQHASNVVVGIVKKHLTSLTTLKNTNLADDFFQRLFVDVLGELNRAGIQRRDEVSGHIASDVNLEEFAEGYKNAFWGLGRYKTIPDTIKPKKQLDELEGFFIQFTKDLGLVVMQETGSNNNSPSPNPTPEGEKLMCSLMSDFEKGANFYTCMNAAWGLISPGDIRQLLNDFLSTAIDNVDIDNVDPNMKEKMHRLLKKPLIEKILDTHNKLQGATQPLHLTKDTQGVENEGQPSSLPSNAQEVESARSEYEKRRKMFENK